MPTLTNDGTPGEDVWPVSQDPHTDSLDPYLVPQERWQPGAHRGLQLSTDVEPDATHAQAQRIAIKFAAFNDGRGLSLAVLPSLRSRRPLRVRTS